MDKSERKWLIGFCIWTAVMGTIAIVVMFTARPQPLTNGDTNHLYWKDIAVVVTDVEHKHWLSGYAHYFSTKVTVWSEEYQLEYTEEIEGKGEAWEYRVGDTVQAELLTWKNNETGEINRRAINRVYG